MTWPPEGSDPQTRPQPAPRPPDPRPQPRPRRKLNPHVLDTEPATPPKFNLESIGGRRAALWLGGPAAVLAVTLLVVFASPVALAAGAAAVVLGVGGVVLYRRRRGLRSPLRRPAGGRTGGRFTFPGTGGGAAPRGRIGRAMGRVFGPRAGRTNPASRTAGGTASRPGGRLRGLLPSWAGGSRKPASRTGAAGQGAGAGGGRGGRFRSMVARLRKPGSASAPASTSRSASRTTPRSTSASRGQGAARPGGRPAGAGGRISAATRRAASRVRRAVGLGGAAPSSTTGGKQRTSTNASGGRTSRTAPVLRVFKRIANRSAVGAVALYDAVTGTGQYAPKKKGSKKKGRKRESKKSSLLSEARERRERARRQGNPDDTDPPASDDEDDDPYGAEAAPDDPLHPALPEPEWPNVDVDDIPDLPPPPLPPPREPDPAPWPDYDVDDYAPKSEQRPPMQSLPVERGREPLPPPVSPPPNRKTYRTTHTHGGTMKSADTYVQMIDNSTPASYSTTCREAAEQARRDAATKEEDAKKLRLEASDFDTLIGVGNKEAAQKLRAEAANCEQDSRNRLVWAARLDGMANDADSKIAS